MEQDKPVDDKKIDLDNVFKLLRIEELLRLQGSFPLMLGEVRKELFAAEKALAPKPLPEPETPKEKTRIYPEHSGTDERRDVADPAPHPSTLADVRRV